MPSTSNAVGTLLQQGPTPLLAKIIGLLLVFMKDGVPLFVAVLFLILYYFQYFSLSGPGSFRHVAPQRPPYLYNEHETIASNNFYNNNTQAEHAAPRNNLLLQYSLGGEPTASGIIAATAPIDHLLSISGTKKGSFIARSTPPRRSTTARPRPPTAAVVRTI